jgi:hypothetical protein
MKSELSFMSKGKDCIEDSVQAHFKSYFLNWAIQGSDKPLCG